jgi:hypothetical protein
MIIRAITRKQINDSTDYTVYFQNGKCLVINTYNEICQGISYWGDYFGINDLDIEEGIIKGGVYR